MPSVTIGFCVRNSERTIKASLGSILKQEYPENCMKIVIVDGNSADRTIEVARKLVGRSGVESEFYSDEGRGLGAARQLVLDHSNGDYIVWIDGDVVVSSDFVENQVKFMESSPQVGVATGVYLYCEETSMSTAAKLQVLSKSTASLHFTPTKEYRGLPPNDASIYRVEALKQVGGFDLKIKGASEDEDIIARIMEKGWVLAANKNAGFMTFPRGTWRELWEERRWFGYGKHFLYHKRRFARLSPLPLPIVYSLRGLIDGLEAYKLTLSTHSFLMPIYYFFSTCASWVGYLQAHKDGYGHSQDSEN